MKTCAGRVVQLLGQALEGEAFSAKSGAEQWNEAVRLFRERPVLLVWDNFESVLPAFATLPLPGGAGGGKQNNDPSQPPLEGEEPKNTAMEKEETASGILGFDAAARAELPRLFTALTEGDPLPRGRLLVTCRPAQAGLPGIRELDLAGLARPDALHLLRAVTERKNIGLERAGCGRAAMDRLCWTSWRTTPSPSSWWPRTCPPSPRRRSWQTSPATWRSANPSATRT